MGTQKKIAKEIIDKKADYILQVKRNQETLENEISEYFEKEVFPEKKKELEDRCILKTFTMTTDALK